MKRVCSQVHAFMTMEHAAHPRYFIACNQEECRAWDVNEVVFSPGLWGTYHALMRADFTLFDEYIYTHEGGWTPRPSLLFENLCLLATAPINEHDRLCMVDGWQRHGLCHR